MLEQDREDLRSMRFPVAILASIILHLTVIVGLRPGATPHEEQMTDLAILVAFDNAAEPSRPAVGASAEPGVASVQTERPAEQPLLRQPPLDGVESSPAPTAAPSLDVLQNVQALPPVAPPQPEPLPPRSPPAADPRPRDRAATASRQEAQRDYVLQVVGKLAHARFDAAAGSDLPPHGVLVARLTVSRSGALAALSLAKESGSPRLDRSVQDAIRKAAPFAPLPASYADDSFTFIVPINYTQER